MKKIATGILLFTKNCLLFINGVLVAYVVYIALLILIEGNRDTKRASKEGNIPL
ncbi:hypothetical protein RhiirC2_210382 [Rhizophagus irregularis]|uniref:Uncharacterized protein n=1 Tax=Rhizophagus irregularis TaxID=588596 RepID=A0A2N1NPI7_9GLOM|nr:hypothetical protein RhiirC2_210382 [Rhizophagus irregularis]